MIGRAYVGISGWRYPPWRGSFYPKGLAHRRELEYAASRLSSIEINGSFYALQRPEHYQRWYAETPNDFMFSVKGGRFITHMKKLRDVQIPLANFFGSGVLALADKLGPLLWQLPPNLGFDPDRLSEFFDLLPRTTMEAAALAQRHDERLAERSWTTTDEERPLRHAVEVRHESYRAAGFLPLLRERDIAIVVADTAGKWPLLETVTSDFAYLRLHGDEELYVSGYSEVALDRWAAQIHGWRSGEATTDGRPRDVYVYFDNDVKVHAPYNAIDLAKRLDALAGG
ncbi:MAG: DUF72 domain-containing protein [Geodermatophilaceae bacterium]|nr:DUF72 domain-containing protein [Geodermatophilaceae bacterium]MDQ3475845.1 DUF72 domain-containing protein [Actinomycetota bacterium]